MGQIAEKVATMRGCSLQQIVDEIARMEDGPTDIFGVPASKVTANAATALERDAEFHGQFWPCYPHKTGKPVALRAFIKARKLHSLGEIMIGLQRYIDTRPADRPWLNPSTFLNQARYLDQPAATSKPSKTSELRNDLRNRIGERSEDTRSLRQLSQRQPFA